MAEMITAERAAVGMRAKCGVGKAHAARMTRPVTQPPKGVRTPEAELMADRPKEAVMGRDPTNEPTNWHIPSAMISCEASIFRLGAKVKSSIRLPFDKCTHTILQLEIKQLSGA